VHDLLLSYGIHVTVVDPVFIKPLDKELLREVCSTHSTIITIEEHVISSGLGSIIDSFILSEHIEGTQVYHFGIKEEFIHHGSHKDITIALGLDPNSITEYILKKVPSLEVAIKD
jgi:1-deoxy-D-xylulose-5-phosphate synthase